MLKILSLLIVVMALVKCGSPREQVNPASHPNSAEIKDGVSLTPDLMKFWGDQGAKMNLNCLAMVKTKRNDTVLVGLRNPCPPVGVITNTENVAFKLKLGLNLENKKREGGFVHELLYKDKYIVGYIASFKQEETTQYTLLKLCNFPTPEAAQCTVAIDKATAHLVGITPKDLDKGPNTKTPDADRKKALTQVMQ